MSERFIEFITDQLAQLPELRVKRMFGGHGLYSGEQFFAIVMNGRLYFKTDDATREDYTRRGMEPFIYEKARRTMIIKYFEVPPDVLENHDELATWAGRAIRAAANEKKT